MLKNEKNNRCGTPARFWEKTPILGQYLKSKSLYTSPINILSPLETFNLHKMAKKFTLLTACLILLLSSVNAFIQNGTYYQIDYGDNYYLTETTISTGGGGGGGTRIDITNLEETVNNILIMLENDSGYNVTELIERLTELQNNTERLRNLTLNEIADMNRKITRLFMEKTAPYLTTLSQPIYMELYPREYTQSMVMIKNT
ncbi:unnamed protein product, partial [marine sediment metagenome]